MQTKLQMVEEFNKKIVNLFRPNSITGLSDDRMDWFENVVHEELDEFRVALHDNNNVGMLDALVDMTYFILGRVYECGFTESQWDRAFSVVHEANMTKHRGNKGRGSDVDAIKDSTWVGPEERIQDILLSEETKPLTPLEPITNFETRKPSVYIENDGTQQILSINDINLFAKMSPVFKEVTELCIKKSQDYNSGNSQPDSRANYFPFGLLSYAQMLHTKSQRLNSLAQSDKTPNNESIRDTLLDMINYATFAIEAIDKGEI